MLSSTRARERSHSSHSASAFTFGGSAASSSSYGCGTVPASAVTSSSSSSSSSSFLSPAFNPFSGASVPASRTVPLARLHHNGFLPLPSALGSEHATKSDAFASRATLVLVSLLLLLAGAWQFGGNAASRRLGLSASISAPPISAAPSSTWSPPQPAFATIGAVSLASAATRSTLSSRAALPDHVAEPRVLVRILSSGSSHAELERLLASLQAATYEAADVLDVEILIDLPRLLADSPLMPATGDEDEEQPVVAPAAHELQLAKLNDPVYQAAKYEYELVLLHARNFHWTRGSVSVRAVDASAPQLGGFFNQMASWTPSPTSGPQGEEFALVLRDANVVARDYFQALKRLLKAHFMSPAPGTDRETMATFSIEKPVQDRQQQRDPDLWGLVLEPSETLLAADGGGAWTPRSPEAAFLSALQVKDPSAPLLALAQSFSTSSRGGGLVLRARHFAAFKVWLITRGLMKRDPLAAPVSQDYGAPTAVLYDRAQGPETSPATCVRGVISNAWPKPPLSPSADPTEQALAHSARIEQPWLILGLLQRFAHERGLLLVQPVWSRDGNRGAPVLVSSSAFTLPPSETNDPASASSVAPPLPPLRRELLAPGTCNLAALSATLPSVVFDFSGRAVSRSLIMSQRSDTAPSQADCEVPNEAPGPPSNTPTDEQLATLAEVQRAALALLQPLISASSSGVPVVSSTVEGAVAPLDIQALPPAELLRMALRTAQEHRSDLTSRPTIPGGDSGGVRILDRRELHENLTSIELRRWEEYEVDFQFQLQHITADGPARAKALAEHAELRAAHEAHLAHIREELDAKKLVDQLKTHLGTIQRQEREESEDRAIEAYKEKKKRLKDAQKKKSADASDAEAEDEAEEVAEKPKAKSKGEDKKSKDESASVATPSEKKSSSPSHDPTIKFGKPKPKANPDDPDADGDIPADSASGPPPKAKKDEKSAKEKSKPSKEKDKKGDKAKDSKKDAKKDPKKDSKKDPKKTDSKSKDKKGDDKKSDEKKKEKDASKKKDPKKDAKKDAKKDPKKDPKKEPTEKKKEEGAKPKKDSKEDWKDSKDSKDKDQKKPASADEQQDSDEEVAAVLAAHAARRKAAQEDEIVVRREREAKKKALLADALKLHGDELTLQVEGDEGGGGAPTKKQDESDDGDISNMNDEAFERLVAKRTQEKKKKAKPRGSLYLPNSV